MINNSKLDILAYGIIGVGIALRLWSFYDGRSLFLDEANLALNIAELQYSDFFQPLKYQQYAPPFYLVVVKTSTLLFGQNEWSLRLPSLIAGLLTLFLFYTLLRLLVHDRLVVILALLLLSSAPFIIRYSTELKQYSSDILIALALLFLALKIPLQKIQLRHFLLWSLAGMGSIWASMPAVFILTGIGGYYGWQFFTTQNRNNQLLLHFCWVGISWIASFFLLYQQVLQPSLQEEHLLNFHTPYFFPLNPFAADSWQQAGLILRGLFVPIVGYTAMGLGLGALLFVWGSIRLFRAWPARFLLVFLPILATILASAAEQFSLLPRVSLFLVPLILLLISVGIENATGRIPGRWKLLPYALLLIGFSPIIKNIGSLGRSTEIEDLRSAIEWAKEKEAKVFVHHEADPAYRYYSEYHDKREQLKLNAVSLRWDQPLTEALAKQHPERFVLLHSHLLSETSRNYMRAWVEEARKTARLKEEYKAEGAAAWLFEP